MNKVVWLLCAPFVVLGMAGCGDETEPPPADDEAEPRGYIIASEADFLAHPAYVAGGTGEIHNPHVLRGFSGTYLALRNLDFHFALVDVTIDARSAPVPFGIEVRDVRLRGGRIESCQVSGSPGVGILVDNAPGLRIVDTVVEESQAAGISVSSSPGASVAGCRVSNADRGILVEGSDRSTLYHSSVDHCSVGIELTGPSLHVSATDSELLDNEVGIRVADVDVYYATLTNNRVADSGTGVVVAGSGAVLMGNHVGPSTAQNIAVEDAARLTTVAMNVFERPGDTQLTDEGQETHWWIDGASAWFEIFIGTTQGLSIPVYTDVPWSNVFREPAQCDDEDAPLVEVTDAWGHPHSYRDDGPSCLHEERVAPRWLGPQSYMH